MKKCIAILLCVCILSAAASASDDAPDFLAEFVTLFGEAPVAANFSSDEEYQASYEVWFSALENYVFLRSEAYEQQKAEEAARLASEQEAAQKAAEAERAAESIESADSNNETAEAEQAAAPPEAIASAGSNHETDSSVSVSPGPVNQYPDRVRVDLAGNIWSLDGELLSPGTTPASDPDEDAALLVVTDPDTLDVVEMPTGDIIIEEHSCTRTADVSGFPAFFDLDELTMRSALVAIFGEYRPKMQTVSTYYDGQLLDTSTEYVPGIAGMDMEWIAGVTVFTVLLYCLMKFLGGVFK